MSMKEAGRNTWVWRKQDAIQKYEGNKTQYKRMKETGHNTRVWSKQDAVHEYEGSKTQYMSMKETGHNTWAIMKEARSNTWVMSMKEARRNTREWRKQDAIQENEVSKTQLICMKEVGVNTRVCISKTQYVQKSMREARRNTVQFTVVWRQQDEIHKLSIVWRKQDRIQEYEGISLEEAAECIQYIFAFTNWLRQFFLLSKINAFVVKFLHALWKIGLHKLSSKSLFSTY